MENKHVLCSFIQLNSQMFSLRLTYIYFVYWAEKTLQFYGQNITLGQNSKQNVRQPSSKWQINDLNTNPFLFLLQNER